MCYVTVIAWKLVYVHEPGTCDPDALGAMLVTLALGATHALALVLAGVAWGRWAARAWSNLGEVFGVQTDTRWLDLNALLATLEHILTLT